MEFLKRHYEKLILLVLLILFVVSMVHIIDIIDQTKNISKDKLMIPESKPDHVVVDFTDKKYDSKELWEDTKIVWDASKSRGEVKSANFSDLTYVFPMAKCPHCNKIIPRSYFNGEKCPLCNNDKVLPIPPEKKEEVFVKTASDKDGDGIPDDVETTYNLNPSDPYDARLDSDRDGFSNVFEYDMETALNSAKSHPPMWYRYKLVDLRRIKLPLMLKSVNTQRSTDPNMWDLQIQDTKTGLSSAYMLNGTMKIDNKDYQIVKIDLKQTEIPAATADGTPQIKDESVIHLEQFGGNDKISMKVNEDVFSSNIKAILLDTAIEKSEKAYDVGETFIAKNWGKNGKSKKYKIHSINEEEKTVTFANPDVLSESKNATLDSNKEEMVVTKEGKIPEERMIRFNNEKLDDSSMLQDPSNGQMNRRRSNPRSRGRR